MVEEHGHQENELRSFIAEVEAMKETEEREHKTGHFKKMSEDEPGFHPEELTVADKEVWDKIKDGTITRADLDAYRDTVADPATRAWRSDVPYSRCVFYELVANKGAAVIGEREIEEQKKLRR